MSRSYKKTPIVKLVYSCSMKVSKKLSNKKIRRHKSYIANGNQFKKIADICIYEYRSYKSLQKLMLENEIYGFDDPIEKVTEEWKRRYYRK